MIQGEPLEETPGKDAEGADTLGMGLVMHAPDSDRAAKSDTSSDYFSRTIESVVEEMEDDVKPVEDTLDSDVDELVSALAEAETERDDEWIETAQDDDKIESAEKSHAIDKSGDKDSALKIENSGSDDDRENSEAEDGKSAEDALMVTVATSSTGDSVAEKKQETDTLIDAVLATSSDTSPEESENSDSAVEEAIALVTEPSPAPKQDDASPGLLGLQAINVLNEKITSSEGRYDDALTKIGHALGLIAERIDGLESRMTNQTIASVALAAAPPSMDDAPIDDSVAPYIARAERELKARKESGSMDIFDRIAKAAESEFDGQASVTETRVIDNPGDGRRVGTKRWQPSKTVKRRMEQLEQARGGVAVKEDATAQKQEPAARTLRADVDAITATESAKATSRAQAKASPEPVLDLDDEEEDDSGLSVVPGARGRRRNRARKSRLDEDFENVFVEDEAKPSIQSLRRKMRDRPVEVPEDEASKGGMLGNILGKKSAKKTAPVEPDDFDEDDEDELMAAFDAPEERAERAERKPAKSKSAVAVESDDSDGKSGVRFAGGPLLYVLIAGAAAAGFFVWKTYLA